MESKFKIIALFGKSASGKDTIQKYLVSNLINTNEIVSYTTRPKRDYEIEGVDYHFITEEKFKNLVQNNKMLEHTEFREWYYGTCIDTLKKDKINIGVFNLDGIHKLLEDERLMVIPIHIWAPDKIRLQRSLNREENPDCAEICRRFLADEKDFNEKMNFVALEYENIKDKITILEDIDDVLSWWTK